MRFKERFCVEMTEIFAKSLEQQVNHGLLEIEDDYVRLTKQGKLLGNEVFQAFLGIID